MAPTSAVELTTEEFGRWAARARLVFPVPLNSGYAARVELDWDELLTVSENRLEVTNGLDRTDADLPAQVRAMLRYAVPTADGPRARRVRRSGVLGGGETLAVGLGAGSEGLVVVDSESTVRLVRTSVTELASAVVAAMPALRGVAIERYEVSDRALSALGEGAGARGLDRFARNAAGAAGIPLHVVGSLARLHGAVTAGGMIGAVRYAEDEVAPSNTGADWYEGPTGAVLKRDLGGGRFVLEPATRASLTSAAMAAMSAVTATGVTR